MGWYLKVLKKYAVFSGRARRVEFWDFFLFNFLITCVLIIIDRMLGLAEDLRGGLFSGLYTLAVFTPYLAVTVRRLHDTGRSGAWLLIVFIPSVFISVLSKFIPVLSGFISVLSLLGFIVLLIFLVSRGQSGANQYNFPIPDRVKAQVATIIEQFNQEFNQQYVPRYDGSNLYLDRINFIGKQVPICRLIYTGDLNSWEFSIYRCSKNRYDPDAELMIPSIKHFDGTVKGAMKVGLKEHPP